MAGLERVIFHCDCNNFFASVELLEYPALREKPVAVSGSEDGKHGIILAKNEIAKKFNVKTAEATWEARRKCPELVLLPPHREKYVRFSKQINQIYAQYTDRVEPFGIDESWLDMTGSWQLFGKSPGETADRLRREVFEETGLTISVGVSFNKIFAKLASDMKKPNATTIITEKSYKDIIWPLPVTTLLFVGSKSAETMHEIGIDTIGQLAAADGVLLKQVVGKQGAILQRYARGEDDAEVSPVGYREPVKSVGNGRTFRRNLVGHRDIRIAVGALCDEVATRLRAKNLYATSLQVIIKNPELRSISRQKPLPYATNLTKDLTENAMELVTDNWDMAKPVRMLTVTGQNLTDQPFAVQTSLFAEPGAMNEKRKNLEQTIDVIRKKYGKSVIKDAGVMHNDIGLHTEEDPTED